MSVVLHERIRRLRARVAVRNWKARQARHAAGVWLRLARLLAFSESAHAISDADAARLAVAPEPPGLDLHPPKHLYFVTGAQLASLPSRRSIPLRLGPEMLSARNVALVPFVFKGQETED